MKTRNSNIELLRIFSMFLITLSHTNMITFFFPSRVWFSQPITIYYWEDMLLQCWGGVGDCLFSLITIWFCLDKKFNVRKTIVFYAKIWLLCILFCVVDSIWFHTLSKESLLQSIFNPFDSCHYWYLPYFFLLSVSIPAVKKLLDMLSQEQLTSVIILFTVLLFYRTTFISGAISFIFNYCTGLYLICVTYYVKKYGWKAPFNKFRYCLLAFLLMNGYITYNNILYQITENTNYISLANQQFCFTALWPVYIGLFIFFFVVNTKPFYSKLINSISKNVIGIYIVSCGFLGTNIINARLQITGRKFYTYMPKVVLTHLAIAVISLIIWSLYSIICDFILGLISKKENSNNHQ